MFRDLPFRSHAAQLVDCASWLADCARPSRSAPLASYRLKHLVQAACGNYVSGAALVQAAVAMGFEIVGTPTRQGNAWLALALKRGSGR